MKDLNDYVGEGEIIQGTVGGVKPADTLLQFLTRQSLENVTQLVLIITFFTFDRIHMQLVSVLCFGFNRNRALLLDITCDVIHCLPAQ